MAIDPRIEATLKQAGQIGVSAINRSLYGLDSLTGTITQASQFDVPNVQSMSYQGFNNLDLNQRTYFDQSSKIIADNTNNAINALESNLRDRILPQIKSNAQDQAVISGQISGDLGLDPVNSSRNLSFISNAQAIGQQQVLASVNEFSNNLTNALTQGQGNQVQLLGQATQAEMANKQFREQQDQFLTQVRGKITRNGVDTGESTLAKIGQDFQQNLSLRNQIFNEDISLSNLTGEIFRQGQETGRDTFAKDQFDFSSNLSTQQFDFSKQTTLADMQFREDQFRTGATGDLYLDGVNQGIKTLAAQDTESVIQARDFNTEQVKKQIQSYEANIAQAKSIEQLFNPTTPEQAANLASQMGDAAGLYWSTQAEIDKDGNVTQVPVYNETSIPQKGLMLNVDFNSQAYKDYVKNAGQDPNSTPEALLANDVMNAISRGKAVESLNKIAIQSDNGNKTLLALKTSDNGETGYSFKSIDMSKLNDTDKQRLSTELYNLSTTSPNLLQEANSVISKYTDYRDLGAIEYMANLSSSEFNVQGNRAMTNTLPKNRQLMAGIIGSAKGNTVNLLADQKLININEAGNGFNFEPLQNIYNTAAKINLNNLAGGNVINLFGKSNSKELTDTIKKSYNANQLPVESQQLIKGLSSVNSIISSQYPNNEPYSSNLFRAFVMGSLNVPEAEANGLYALAR